MRIEDIDMRTAGKIVIPIAFIALAMVYLFLRSIVQTFFQAKRHAQLSDDVHKLRMGQPPGPFPPTIVRKTDLYPKLNAKQRKSHAQAESLLLQKMYREAAYIFEGIGFQRKAIDILEHHGFVEEAAQVLLKMNLINRVGVLYERNGHYAKAIEYYSKENRLDQIAKVYEKMAWKDYHYYKEAATFFFRAGLIDPCLASLAKIVSTPEILKVCLDAKKYDFLWNYLQVSYNARAILPQMTAPDLQVLTEPVALTPQNTLVFAAWLACNPRPDLLRLVLVKLSYDQNLASAMWGSLDQITIDRLVPLVSQMSPALSTPVSLMYSKILVQLKQDAASAVFKNLSAKAA